jgi:ATP-binding cassette subfamily B multidrug efflux pump
MGILPSAVAMRLAVQPGWYRDMYRYQQLEAALDDAPQDQEEAADA